MTPQLEYMPSPNSICLGLHTLGPVLESVNNLHVYSYHKSEDEELKGGLLGLPAESV